MIIHASIGILNVFGTLGFMAWVLSQARASPANLICFSAFLLGVSSALHYVMFRLGDALTRGQRAAVYGLVIVAGLCLPLTGVVINSMTLEWALGTAATILAYTAICVAGIVAAFTKWEKFE